MSNSPPERCGTCHYGREDDGGDLWCHRLPPQVVQRRLGRDVSIDSAAWPLVLAGEWCGEWAEAEGARHNPQAAPPPA